MSRWCMSAISVCALVSAGGMSAGAKAPVHVHASATRIAASTGFLWRWQNPLPQGNSLSAVSCPDLYTCFAVGSGTILASHDTGRTWLATFDRKYGDLSALSCPDPLTCYAIANTGPDATAILGTRDGGASWIQLWHGKRGLDRLVCPRTLVCISTGMYAAAIVSTRDGGKTWAATPSTFHPADLACPTDELCYASLATHLVPSPPPSVAVTTNGGTSWSVRSVGVAKGKAQLSAIRCVSATTCTLLAYGDADTQYLPFLLRTENGGGSWMRQILPRDAVFRNAVLVCPTVSTCYLGGDNGVVNGVLVGTTNSGRAWTRGGFLPFVPTAMSCPDAMHCVATGNGGALLRTATGWATRSQVSHNPASSQATNPSFAFQTVSCATRNICYAAGDWGSLVKTVNGGRSWVATGSQLRAATHGGAITSLACPGAAVCFAGQNAGPQNPARTLSTRDGGYRWSLHPGPGLSAIACPTRRVCYAGGIRGAAAVSKDGGRTWVHHQTPLRGKPYAIQTVVCATPRICYATALGPSEPPPHPSSNLGAVLRTHDGGRSWQSTFTDPYPFALACTTPAHCFALLAGPLVHSIVPILVTENGGFTWHRQLTLPPGRWNAATCSTRTTCYLAGAEGEIAVTRDAGRTWQQEPTPALVDLQSIRCVAADSCYAVGRFGAILARLPG